ncbi:IS3 family transposase [Pediococcus stilesii]|uniref:IS3 family transposase n=1 Tax=Pediococcus stilesii TaxID=331679 RepID=UPI002078648E|nr:IS3 family transposase [Pediococcus stilesii]
MRVDYPNKYSVGALLNYFEIKRPTYYDERHRIKNFVDKYDTIKTTIKCIFIDSHETYGYRRIHAMLLQKGIHLAKATVLRLMNEIGIDNTIYRNHTSTYKSYKGSIGNKAPNILNQEFNEHEPYKVVHTDITQIRLSNQKWGYISAMTDEASKEVLALSISDHPDKKLIFNTLEQLENVLPEHAKPIIHSDQGWHYQIADYQKKLKDLNFVQSMSRKGNCHDNAPIESFFNLLKRECLNRIKISDLSELKQLVDDYLNWFNSDRISMKTKGLSPIEYRKQALAI